MNKRVCKNTGLELSLLGTGCWTFGGGTYWGKQDQKDVNQVVHASIDMGINYFDTAEVYNEGRSETSLGKAMTGIPRDRIVIGTKVSPSNCYKETLLRHCEASLNRLRTDYIDVYMIHWPLHPHSIRHFTNDKWTIENPPEIEEAFESLRLLKQQGKIRNFGVSNFSSNRLKNLPFFEIAVNQLPYNLLCRAIEYETLQFCEVNGIGVIGYMALMQGILSDKYGTIDEIPVLQHRTRHFDSKKNKECRHGEAGAEEDFLHGLTGIRDICKRSGISMVEMAIKWMIQNPENDLLLGQRSTSRMRWIMISFAFVATVLNYLHRLSFNYLTAQGYLRDIIPDDYFGYIAAAFFVFMDPVWYFITFWIGRYLADVYQWNLVKIGWFAMFPFIVADFGNILGGLFTQYIIKKGIEIHNVRKIAVAIFGLIMALSLLMGPYIISGPTGALIVLAIAGFGYAAYTANTLAFPADVVPQSATASVWEIASVGAGLGGVIFQSLSGVAIKNLSLHYNYTFAYGTVFIGYGILALIGLSIVLFMIGPLVPDKKLQEYVDKTVV